MTKLKFTLPFPPSSNRYWRNFRGRMVKSAEARAYHQQISLLLRNITQFTGEVVIALDFYRPKKQGDLDNRIKICLDALNGIAFEDDKQVAEIYARRFEDKLNPRVEVTVYNRYCL